MISINSTVLAYPVNRDFLRNGNDIFLMVRDYIDCYTSPYYIEFSVDSYEDKGSGVFYPVNITTYFIDKTFDGATFVPLTLLFDDMVDNVHTKIYSSIDFDVYYLKEGDVVYFYFTDLDAGERVLINDGVFGFYDYPNKIIQAEVIVPPLENVSFTLQDISDLIDTKNATLLQNLVSNQRILSLASLNGSNGASFIDGAEVSISDAKGVIQDGFDIWTVKSSHISMTDIARNLSTIIYVLESGERTMITPSMYVVKAPAVV